MIREDGTVVFEGKEQEEINRIVGERLGRENITDMKETIEYLKEFGYEGTPAEIKQAVKAQAEAYRIQQAEAQRQQELEQLKEQAKNEGTSPELLAEIRELKKELAEIKGERTALKDAEEQKRKANELWNAQFKEFTDAYPDVDADQLAEDSRFKKFIKGKNMPLKELYEDFIDFVGETETKAIAKKISKEERSTGNGKGNGSEGGSYGLTARQQELAKENGISLKDFAESLKLIKK